MATALESFVIPTQSSLAVDPTCQDWIPSSYTAPTASIATLPHHQDSTASMAPSSVPHSLISSSNAIETLHLVSSLHQAPMPIRSIYGQQALEEERMNKFKDQTLRGMIFQKWQMEPWDLFRLVPPLEHLHQLKTATIPVVKL